MSTTQSNRRSGKKLKTSDIDGDKKVNDHLRTERRKNHFNVLMIVSGYGAMIAIPVLYGAFLYVNRHNSEELSKDIWSGLTATVGFVFGNLLKGIESKD